jgi:hypothetical protein
MDPKPCRIFGLLNLSLTWCDGVQGLHQNGQRRTETRKEFNGKVARKITLVFYAGFRQVVQSVPGEQQSCLRETVNAQPSSIY